MTAHEREEALKRLHARLTEWISELEGACGMGGTSAIAKLNMRGEVVKAREELEALDMAIYRADLDCMADDAEAEMKRREAGIEDGR